VGLAVTQDCCTANGRTRASRISEPETDSSVNYTDAGKIPQIYHLLRTD